MLLQTRDSSGRLFCSGRALHILENVELGVPSTHTDAVCVSYHLPQRDIIRGEAFEKSFGNKNKCVGPTSSVVGFFAE